MFKKKHLVLILQVLLLNVNGLEAAKVFLDLGDVVVHTSKAKTFGSIASNVFGYLLDGNSPFNVKSGFEDFLRSVYGIDPASGLPLIYRAWQTDQISSRDMVKDIKEKISASNFSKAKKDFYSKISESYLPENLVNFMDISHKAKKYIDKLRRNGHEIYIISNWDSLSFPLLVQKYKEFFANIPTKNIIISAHIGVIKPDRDIFEYVKKQFNLTPKDLQESWFIDDRVENVNSAKEAGFNAIHHDSWRKTKRILQENKLI